MLRVVGFPELEVDQLPTFERAAALLFVAVVVLPCNLVLMPLVALYPPLEGILQGENIRADALFPRATVF